MVVLCIDNQLKLVDALIGNIKGYHEDVKQKCKKAFQKSGTLPDNLDEHIFTGKYSHSVTLQSILDLLEFLDLDRFLCGFSLESWRLCWWCGSVRV